MLRERIAAAGIRDATVTVPETASASTPAGARAQIAAFAVPGELGIYDWEASVLGPDGKPGDGPSRPARTPGGGRRVALRGRAAGREASAGALLGAPPTPGPRWRAARHRRGPSDRWYALADKVAVGNASVASARAQRDPATGDPIVAVELDAQGQAAFHTLTRGIAQRGADAARPGDDPMRTAQHLAIVLDDHLASVPFIDHRQAPDGIDGRGGVQIQGGLTPERARQIAIILESGPMPASLAPLGRG